MITTASYLSIITVSHFVVIPLYQAIPVPETFHSGEKQYIKLIQLTKL